MMNKDPIEKNNGESASENVVLDYVSALDEESEKKRTDDSKRKMLEMFYDFIETLAFAACFVLVFFGFIARPAKVVGSSMESTLTEGDTVIVSKLFYEPEYGDIVVFQNRDSHRSDPLIKRVIATEGQWVNIVFHNDRTMTVYVADSLEELDTSEPLDESGYVLFKQDAHITSDLKFPIEVPEGTVFAMGDNRNHSLDSRSTGIGFIPEEHIVGRLIVRFLPLNKFGAVPMVKK